jgi:WD40 repeat protein
MMPPSVTGFSTPLKTDVTTPPFNINTSIFAHRQCIAGSVVDRQPNSVAIAEEANESTMPRQQRETLVGNPTDVFSKFPYLFVPFLDRVSLLRLFSANREIYAASQEAREAVTLLWPEKKLRVGSRVFSVAFSPDGGLLACGCENEDIRLWNRVNGQCTLLEGHTSWVRSVSFSPDGNFLASGSADRTIRLWKLADQSCRVLEGHSSWVMSVAFSPDGSTIASGSADGSVSLWDVREGRRIRTLRDNRMMGVYSVAWAPDGKTAAAGYNGGKILEWNLSAIGEGLNSATCYIQAHRRVVHNISYSPDGSYLASDSNDATIKLWAVVADLSCSKVFTGHCDRVLSVCFSPNGKIIASGSSDKSIRLWNVKAGNGTCLLHLPAHHEGNVMSVAFSPDGRNLASGSDDETVRLFDISS